MSIIVRDKQTNEIMLYCKGADSFIKPLLTEFEQNTDETRVTMEQIDIYAEKGLRTLLCSKKVIPEDEYAEWNARWEQASNLIGDERD